MDSDERDVVTDIVFRKNNLEVDNETIDEVTLKNNIVKETTIEINFNTGATKRKVIGGKYSDMTDTKKAKTNNNDKDKGKAEIYKALDDQDQDEPSDLNEMDSENRSYHTESIKLVSIQSRAEPIPLLLPKSSSNKFNCDECDASYTRNYSLMKHKKTKHDCISKPSDPVVSLIESILFDDEEEKGDVETGQSIQIDEHQISTEGGIFVCELCEISFKERWSLEVHKTNIHSKQEIQSNCDKEEVNNVNIDEENEDGVFVGVEVDATTAKKEGEQVAADPFLSAIRDKLLEDEDYENQEGILGIESVAVDNDGSTEKLVPCSIYAAVNVAMQNEFMIL